MAERIGSRLPPESALIVTGDHGMVDLDEGDRHDVSDVHGLAGGVRALGGEARARHVYASRGAESDVLAAWREVVGDRMWVRSREEAIADGWFGPTVVDRARGRIGDVVAAAFAPIGIFDRATDPHQATLVGHHGSLTAAEQHVPLLLVRT
jgi:Type I phosphodiesterase / nucleotide pyrophosphatase